jgi:DeoR family transcriptional regulator, deoxyribose operon repressor
MPKIANTRAVRLARMQELVESGGPVLLAQIAQLLGVTTMTIRRDLSVADAPLTVLGGYVLAATLSPAHRYSLDEARDQHGVHKREAGQRAAELVQPHDSLFIDCGTTMVHFAESLPQDIPLSVVCYSTNIAAVLSRRPNTQLMLLGGLYHASSATFYSDEALQYLSRLGVNKAFISAGGIHPERGASCFNFHEVPVKQAAIRSASESFLIVDESKLGGLRPAFFSPLDSFRRIFVGGVPASSMRKQFKGLPMEFGQAVAA